MKLTTFLQKKWLLLLAISSLLSACQSSPSCPNGTPPKDGVCVVERVVYQEKSCGTDGKTCDISKNEVCYLEQCVPVTDVKKQLACGTSNSKRGVFDESSLTCVNAADGQCSGDNSCLPGYFCDSSNNCTLNKCIEGKCERGVCEPNQGCVEKINCDLHSSHNDCLDGRHCVSINGAPHGLCRDIGDECEPKCNGNRICEFDPTTKIASCKEPAECNTTSDCDQGRQCRGVQCVDSSTIPSQADPLETPTDNNSASNSSDYKAASLAKQLDKLTLTGNDVDWFNIDATGQTPGKTLVITITIPLNDVGLRPLKATLYADDGTTIILPEKKLNGTDQKETTLQLTYELPNNASEIKPSYKLKIASNENPSDQTTLRYSLAATFLGNEALRSCEASNIRPLVPYKVQKGNLVSSGSTSLVSCQDGAGSKEEQIWLLHLDKPSFLNLKVVPGGNQDLAVSIRTTCEAEESALDPKCYDNTGKGLREKIGKKLEAGDHYVVVTLGSHSQAGEGTDYTIEATTRPIICDSSSNQCITVSGSSIAHRCSEDGTEIIDTACSEGCHATLPICAGSEGDSCETPFIMTGKSLQQRFRTRRFTNALNPGEQCFSGVPGATSGRDLVFKVHLEPNEVLLARGSSTKKTAIYTLDSCTNTDSCSNTSRSSSDATPTQLTITNGLAARDIYVVYDYEYRPELPSEFNASYIDVDLQILPKVCDLGASKCVGGVEIQHCNATQTGWDSEFCELGCTPPADSSTPATCQVKQGDRCSNAPTIATDGTEIAGNFKGVTNEVKTAQYCKELTNSFDYSNTGRRTLFYKFEAETSKNYTITYTPDKTTISNAYLSILSSCSDDDLSGSCINGKQNTSVNAVTFRPPQNGTYYVAIQYNKNISPTPSYKIKIESQPITKEPWSGATCNGTTEYTYYDSNGAQQSITCSDCQIINGTPFCTDNDTTKQGDTCGTAKLIYNHTTSPPTTSGTETFKLNAPLTNFLPPVKGMVDRCYFPDTLKFPQGYDAIYRFDLNTDETVKVKLKAKAIYTTAFFKEDCYDMNQCFGNINQIGAGERTLSYTAEGGPKTVFLVIKYTYKYQSYYSETFDWSILPASTSLACQPGMTYCSSQNSSNLIECGDDGTPTYIYSCLNGCDKGYCLPNKPSESVKGDSCSDPIEINTDSEPEHSAKFLLDGENYSRTNDLTCPTTTGADTYFKVYLTTKTLLRIKYQANVSETISLGISDSCQESARCILGEISKYASASNLIERSFKPKVDGYYYIKASRKETQRTAFNIQFNIVKDECDPETSTPECQTDGKLKFCNEGQWEYVNCSGNQCTPGDPSAGTIASCQTPQGYSCADALPVPTNIKTNIRFPSYNTQHLLKNISIQDQVSNTCFVAGALTGVPTYYKVELAEGDIFTATMETKIGNSYLYLIDSCQSSATCLAGRWKLADTAPGNPPRSRTLRYKATKAGTYYLVVQTSDDSNPSSEPYSLSTSIEKASTSCVPHQTICKDSQTLTVCTSNGQSVDVSCDCSDGFCRTETSKIEDCRDPSNMVEITNGYAAIIPFKDIANDIFMTNDSCTQLDTPGPDAFYKVTIPSHGTLRLYTLGKYENSGVKPEPIAFYLLNSCTGLPIDACVAGSNINASHEEETLGFQYINTSDQPEHYFLAVDEKSNDRRAVSSKFFYAEIDQPECSEGEIKCSDDKSSLKLCNPYTYKFESSTCKTPSSGDACVTSGSQSSCQERMGDICQDPIQVEFDATHHNATVTTSYDNQHNHYSLDRTDSPTDLPTPGPDTFYHLTLPAGKTLTVTAESSTGANVALYLTDTCAYKHTDSALAGADASPSNDSSNKETLTYTNSSASDLQLYLIVDSYDSGASGNVSVTLSYN